MNMKRYILIAIAVILISASSYYYFVVMKAKSKKQKDLINGGNNNNTATGTNEINGFQCIFGDEFPLRYGSCGNKVGTLQEKLNYAGESLVVDNKFGKKTRDALVAQYGKEKIMDREEFENIGLKEEKDVSNQTVDGIFTNLQSKIDDGNYLMWTDDGSDEVYESILKLSDDNLYKLAQMWKNRFDNTLYDFIDRRYFSRLTDVDTRIKQRLESIEET